MKKLVFCYALLFAYLGSYCQSVGIGTVNPSVSAQLDVSSTSKGMLVPRMSTAQRTAISSPALGLLVFDSNSNSFWFFNGSAWTNLSPASSGWNLTGNASINAANNFVGTTDNNPLNFRINNLPAGQLHPTSGNISWGMNAGQSASTSHSNIAIGTAALKSNAGSSNLVAIGDSALFTNGVGAVYAADGAFNVAIGSKALYSNDIGAYNAAVGYRALYANDHGSYNSAMGYEALYSNNTGSSNAATGASALYSNSAGNNNTAAGTGSLYANLGGSNNTAVGFNTLSANIYGLGNTAVGMNALNSVTNSSYNTALGTGALTNIINGNYNVAIGYNSGTSSSFNNTVSIGNDGWLNGASNQVFIGNASTAWIGGYKAWSVYSDARLKSDIRDDIKGLGFILKLRPVSYRQQVDNMNAATGNHPQAEFVGKYQIDSLRMNGFLAQEVEKAAAESGFQFSGISKVKSVNELYSLSYESFVVPLVKAVQEQQHMIEELTHQNQVLMARLSQVEATQLKLVNAH